MKSKTLISAFLLAASTLGFSQTIISGAGFGNVSPVGYLGGSFSTVPGKGVVVDLPNRQSIFRVDLPQGTNWTPYTHLQVGIQNMGNKPEMIFIAVASTGLWCYTHVLLTPRQHNRIIIPIDGVTPGLTLPVQPVDNPYAQVFAGSFVDKPRVSWLVVQAPNQSGPTNLLINEMKPVTAHQPTGGFVDQYGQQSTHVWKGKIRSDGDLATAVGARPISGVPPYSADTYGGVLGTSIYGTNTGKWHTEKQNGKWYLLDPLGNRFFSAGVITAGGSAPAFVTGYESSYLPGALPSQTGPFADHYELTSFGTGVPHLTYNFYTSNLQRRLGSDWRAIHVQETLDRLKTWGYNTGADATNFDVRVTGRLPFTETIAVSGNFRRVWDAYNGDAFPDVFDPAWANAVTESLRPAVNMYRANPMLIGFFVDNEAPWAYPYDFPNERLGMIQSILNSPADQPAKIQFVNWLKSRYANNIVLLNAGWLSGLLGFDGLLSGQFQIPQVIPPNMERDFSDFMLFYGRTYFGTIRQKLNVLNFNALYLGCRFRFFPVEMAQAAKEICDVVSFNAYETVPSDHHQTMKDLDAPVMISEVGIGACDMGRIAAPPSLLTESDRAWFFKRYMSDGLSFKNLVGLHYYRWEDNAPSGRYYDRNNSGTGIVSIADVPYWSMVDVMTTGNAAFHNRLLNP